MHDAVKAVKALQVPWVFSDCVRPYVWLICLQMGH